jgi:radical SAM protein with 4Fe4S-binding SPASM domain
VKRVHLYLHGEPMLHPQIVEMVGHIKSKGLAVHLTTNGMPLNKEKMKAILQSGVNSADRFIFSILGYSKDVHERIMKGVNHDRVIKNVYDFIELRRKHKMNGPVIETVFYTMPENEREIDQFFNYWHGVADHVTVVDSVSKQFSEFRTGGYSSIPVRKRTCINLWERMTIFWNGNVTTCIADVDGICRLGSLKEKSITEIWNCEKLLSIKKLHKEKSFQDLPLCSRCDW